MSIVRSSVVSRTESPLAAADVTSLAPDVVRAALDVQLVAAIIAVVDDEPVVRIVPDDGGNRLPSAIYRPEFHATLDEGLRCAVRDDTGLELGHVEQLQTVSVHSSDPSSERAGTNGTQAHVLSIGYLALAHGTDLSEREKANWQSCYSFFPWEDWRHGKPRILRDEIEPHLSTWAAGDENAKGEQPSRHDRMRICFGENDHTWDEEKVVERFDLLADAGMVGPSGIAAREGKPTQNGSAVAMALDHTRSLAVAMSRLRAKIKSRPLVFDLMPERFTLFELQRAVEAILGPHLHKQNFRRLVEHMGLVEPTDGVKSHTGGRPAKLFRFRQECVLERMQPGVRVRSARG